MYSSIYRLINYSLCGATLMYALVYVSVCASTYTSTPTSAYSHVHVYMSVVPFVYLPICLYIDLPNYVSRVCCDCCVFKICMLLEWFQHTSDYIIMCHILPNYIII